MHLNGLVQRQMLVRSKFQFLLHVQENDFSQYIKHWPVKRTLKRQFEKIERAANKWNDCYK